MTTLFLANIGNSDLVVKGAATDKLPWAARPLAAHLNANLDTYWDRIHLPILTKALDYVLAQGQPIETLILFVSDQDPEHTSEDERAKDTCELGKIIRKKLLEQYAQQQWRANQVRLHPIKGNPADYDTTFDYYKKELPRILSHYEAPPDRVYLSLTGGTPAMNSMLLVEGNRVFGLQTINLYDAKERKQPFPLGVGQRLAARSLRAALLVNLDTYQYAAALALAETEGHVLVDSHSNRQVLTGLLRFARDRLAFNFADAAQALDEILPTAGSGQRDRILHMQNQILDMDDAGRLRELYFGAEIKRLNRAYAGWLEWLFRYQESTLRLAVVQRGVQFTDNSREFLDLVWLQAQPGLMEHLATVPRRDGGTGLDPHRSASRPLLRAVLGYLAERDGDEQFDAFLAHTDRFEDLAALRNGWVHRLKGVRRQDVEREFDGDLAQAATTMSEIYRFVAGAELGDNPYDSINDLCAQLLKEA